jgi:hypothetical protein
MARQIRRDPHYRPPPLLFQEERKDPGRHDARSGRGYRWSSGLHVQKELGTGEDFQGRDGEV